MVGYLNLSFLLFTFNNTVSIRLGIIGGGVMAEAILSRLLKKNIYSPETVLVSEPQSQRRNFWVNTYGVQVSEDNREAARATEVLILAVKPQILEQVVNSLEMGFPDRPVIRTMPNTPATVGQGVTAIASGRHAEPEHLAVARDIFAAVGSVVEVPEALMDAVTGLSGSGPAFVALMVEALSDGGVAAGLPRAIASQLAIETVLGTATLLKESAIHPGELKDRVTSPGGTTIAGVRQLEKGSFRSTIIEAVVAAYHRSKDLGRSSEK